MKLVVKATLVALLVFLVSAYTYGAPGIAGRSKRGADKRGMLLAMEKLDEACPNTVVQGKITADQKYIKGIENACAEKFVQLAALKDPKKMCPEAKAEMKKCGNGR